jgi:hypothetical protein
MFGSGPQAGPTQEELAAQRLAKLEKQETAQDDLQRESDRLFRLYSARSAFAGAGSPLRV